MTKYLTAISCAVFLWAFWNASSLGVYAGTSMSKADGQLECRYMTARGLFHEDRAEAITAHSKSSKWCPTTFVVSRDRGHPKPGTINTASGL